MFKPEPWAEAFYNIAGSALAAEEALDYLVIFCHAALALPGNISGRTNADRLGKILRTALSRSTKNNIAAAELALHFIQLMIRRNYLYQQKSIIHCIEKNIKKQKGIEELIVETAVEPEEQLLSLIMEKSKELTGATKINLTVKIIPDLIGGIRLRWGNMVIDCSIKRRLQKMELHLGA